MSASLLEITSLTHFQQLTEQGTDPHGLLFHFSARWCEPCKPLTEFLCSRVSTYPRVAFCSVDVEAHEDVCVAAGVDSVPHVAFYRRRADAPGYDHVADVFGAKLAENEQNLFSLFGREDEDLPETYTSAEEYMKHLINKSRVTVFFTGTPSRPKCCYTPKISALLADIDVAFTYYDVMGSPEMCEKFKEFSKWPTFPQVYCCGVLVGGFDKCKELFEAGKLKEILAQNLS